MPKLGNLVTLDDFVKLAFPQNIKWNASISPHNPWESGPNYANPPYPILCTSFQIHLPWPLPTIKHNKF